MKVPDDDSLVWPSSGEYSTPINETNPVSSDASSCACGCTARQCCFDDVDVESTSTRLTLYFFLVCLPNIDRGVFLFTFVSLPSMKFGGDEQSLFSPRALEMRAVLTEEARLDEDKLESLRHSCLNDETPETIL